MSADTPAIDDVTTDGLEEQSRFIRGLLFGIAFSLPVWGAIIAAVRFVVV